MGKPAGFILVAAALLLAGCQSRADRPISTSLRDLLTESDPIEGPVVVSHEVFSIGGILPTSKVGLLHHTYRRAA